MYTWTRIADDETAQFGTQLLRFNHDAVTYSILVDQSEQGVVSVEHDGKSEDVIPE